MKKTLIAMAVLAASGASMAQSSVTLYGVADIWFGSSKTSVSGANANNQDNVLVNYSRRQTVLESGGVSISRWGMKGSEDLGGGLKANFNLEQGFAIDNGSANGAQFDRQAWVGVSGGFGEVKLGRTGTAYDDILGTNNNTFDSALTARPWVSYTRTASNQIYYAFPAMGGVSGAVSYALGEDKSATTKAGKIVALNVQYAAGPLMVGFAHQAETAGAKLGLGSIGSERAFAVDMLEFANATAAADATTGINATAGDKAKYNLLTGSYDLGVVKLLGSYNTTKVTYVGGESDKAKEFQLGVNVPLSAALTLAAGYGRSAVEFNGVDGYKATAFSAAVSYSMSKRTSVYAGFNNTKTDFSDADFDIKKAVYAVGVRHAF